MSYVKSVWRVRWVPEKTALIECLTRKMASEYSIGVITNDIYTKEDANFYAKIRFFPERGSSAWKQGDALIPQSERMLP